VVAATGVDAAVSVATAAAAAPSQQPLHQPSQAASQAVAVATASSASGIASCNGKRQGQQEPAEAARAARAFAARARGQRGQQGALAQPEVLAFVSLACLRAQRPARMTHLRGRGLGDSHGHDHGDGHRHGLEPARGRTKFSILNSYFTKFSTVPMSTMARAEGKFLFKDLYSRHVNNPTRTEISRIFQKSSQQVPYKIGKAYFLGFKFRGDDDTNF
jgi:hypothetical protein